MGVRALYVIPAKEDAATPIFSKHFKTVELRCKTSLGQLYVEIPRDEEFVRLLLTEVGIHQGAFVSLVEDFIAIRDHCDQEFSNPAFQLKTNSGILWPVIVSNSKSFILCAIIFEENFKSTASNVELTFLGNVAACLEVLNGLAHFIDSNSFSQERPPTTDLLKFVNSALPFGRAVCCNATVSVNFRGSFWRGKNKQPAWNPLPYKGKCYVNISIKEEIRCMQLNQEVISFNMYGTIVCSAEVDGVLPEICFLLTNASEQSCSLLVNANVINVETVSPTSTRIRFHPMIQQNLCVYKITGNTTPPISGNFSMKIVDSLALISVHLKLQKEVKNNFQKLEVHVPFYCSICSVRSHCSQGVLVSANSTLIWNVGTKFASKSLEATLQAQVKLKAINNGKSLVSTIIEPYHSENAKLTLFNRESLSPQHASVIFCMANYIYSGCKIDPQSIVVSTSSKVNRSVASETFSGTYKIWNKDCAIDTLQEEFVNVLDTS